MPCIYSFFSDINYYILIEITSQTNIVLNHFIVKVSDAAKQKFHQIILIIKDIVGLHVCWLNLFSPVTSQYEFSLKAVQVH
jgi:hypothetical protein